MFNLSLSLSLSLYIYKLRLPGPPAVAGATCMWWYISCPSLKVLRRPRISPPPLMPCLTNCRHWHLTDSWPLTPTSMSLALLQGLDIVLGKTAPCGTASCWRTHLQFTLWTSPKILRALDTAQAETHHDCFVGRISTTWSPAERSFRYSIFWYRDFQSQAGRLLLLRMHFHSQASSTPPWGQTRSNLVTLNCAVSLEMACTGTCSAQWSFSLGQCTRLTPAMSEGSWRYVARTCWVLLYPQMLLELALSWSFCSEPLTHDAWRSLDLLLQTSWCFAWLFARWCS